MKKRRRKQGSDAPPAVAQSSGAKSTATAPSQQAAEEASLNSQKKEPVIVGVGASAGGLEALTELLRGLPADTGMAFVLVQHLEPKHESVLTTLLARATQMPVQEAREDMQVESDNVYVIPANADLSVLHGLLHIVGRKAPAGRHLPIDYFFNSLAESRGSRAIGVILSGTASDGTAGVRAIKEAGGITFAQDPASAKFDGMPRNAIASGYVDLVLPPDRIAKELVRIGRHPFVGFPLASKIPTPAAPAEEWTRLFRLLRRATGVDFSLYKQSTIKRRLARRMTIRRVDKLTDYLKILERDRAELDALFDELLILVTEFFRDPDVFVALRSKVFPKILAEKAVGEPVRIWVAGCSTGEEVYSIAISFLECLGDEAAAAQLQIFGTDVSEHAIEKARAGIYSATALKAVSKEQLQRYFTPINGTFQINQPIREMCVFARHDLTRDPPFSKLDLISCRNVLIYMEPVLQKTILAGFYWALKSHGVLLLGKSESLGAYAEMFTATDRKKKLFRKSAGAHVPLGMVQPAYEHGLHVKPALTETPARIDVEREADRVLWERSGYAGLVVNDDLQILHVRGDTSPYVRLVPGKASLQLMRALREEIVLEVRSAIQKARRGERAVRSEGIQFRQNGHVSEVNIELRPLIRSRPEKSFLILFERVAAKPSKRDSRHAKAGTKEAKGRDQEVARLRDELARTRDQVQAIIRDQESTNEELKTANEEALSSMEELQSTNEELETAKEELQSSNEELITLNEQLQNRNLELSQLSTDLGNVFSGVNIPIVLLDTERRIRRFTPPAENLLGVISVDIGRPITKLRLGISIPELDDLIAGAVEKSEIAVREVQSESGRWYSLRVHPFIPGQDKVQGVLMTFVDIDEVKKLQEQAAARAEQSESMVHALLESAAQAILAVDKEGHIKLANVSAETMFGYSRDILLGQSLESLMPERFRAKHVQHRAGWFAQPHKGPMGGGLDLAGLRKDGSEFPIEVGLSSMKSDGEMLGVAFVTDITERKKNEQVLSEYREQLVSEVASLNRLREASERLWRSRDLRAGLEEMIDAGMTLLGADFANIQLLNPQKQALEIAAQRGLGPDFLEHFREISPADISASGRSFRAKERVTIEDVKTDPDYEPHRAAAAAAGYRAVQSTPLFGSEGQLLGMFSMYFRKPHRPTERELLRFDLYAHQAVQFIERLGADERLRGLTGALLSMQESGNREIAGELHDVFSQELVSVGMELSSLKDAKSQGDVPRRLSELGKKIMGLAQGLHQASRALHPAVLEDLGLVAALQQECDSFEKAYGIATDFTAKGVPAKIPKEVALCFYRVAQECLRNISKHAANTDRVRFSLTGDADGITLLVNDKGDGFDLEQALKKGGLGLVSMEERLRLVNGKFAIRSRPGQGTTVEAFVPLDKNTI